jgi:hypothetical protein
MAWSVAASIIMPGASVTNATLPATTTRHSLAAGHASPATSAKASSPDEDPS